MTALQLLGIICSALLLQLAMGIGLYVWRKRPPQGALPAEGSNDARSSAAAWPGWRDFRVVRRHYEDSANSQCSFHLRPVDGEPLPAFLPGQYLTLSLATGADSGGGSSPSRSLTRCYTLSDRPDPTGYRITVKRALAPADRPDLPSGAASNHLHDKVHEGHVLKVRAPAGHFCIDTDTSVPAVFVAGGIGITPMMSMLLWCLTEQPERSVHLFHGVRSSADQAFKSELEALARAHPGFQLHVIYGNPEPGDLLGRDYQHTGRVDLQLLRNTLPSGRHRFYVCGPPAMMQSLVPSLRAWGVREEDIFFEAFGPASVQPAATGDGQSPSAERVSIDVNFRRSGRTLVWDGRDASLLDFAERHHVDIDSGCRTGNCGSCETRVVSGSVDYADKPDFDVATGHCLPCIGRPKSALVLDA